MSTQVVEEKKINVDNEIKSGEIVKEDNIPNEVKFPSVSAKEKFAGMSYAQIKVERKRALKERRKQKLEQKQVGFGDDVIQHTDYYAENGLRKVYPYWFLWNTYVKERWFNRTLLDIYNTEFFRATRSHSLEHLIQTGKIKVNGQVKPCDYVLKNGDKISHIKHRHEIPVLGDPIKIIQDDENYLVVDKPCSIPMHPCGKYRYNSLAIILSKEFGYSNLRTLYRLDRLTSGLVILGKNFKASQVIDKHIKDRTAKKTYVCRVTGEFPEGRIVVDKPIDCASFKVGLYWVDDKNGKESKTEFERLSYNGKTSVVLCYPKTGRTHQIRIHLQYLGFPISNDPLYNNVDVWGKTNGKNGVYEFTKDELELNFLKMHSYEAFIVQQEQEDQPPETVQNDNKNEKEDKKENESEKVLTTVEDNKESEELVEVSKRKIDETENNSNPTDEQEVKKIKIDENKTENQQIDQTYLSSNLPPFDPSKLKIEEDCFECQQSFRDPLKTELIMYLHALSYKFDDMEFRTEMPEWAKEDFVE